MALWSPDYNLLYSLCPRTASSATFKILQEELGGEQIPPEPILDEDGMTIVDNKHSTFRQIQDHKLLPEADFEKAVRAVTVRNPFDSMYSLWHKKRYQYRALLDKPHAFIHRVKGFKQDMEYIENHTFSEWFIKNHEPVVEREGHRKVNSGWTVGATFVMKFENISEDFANLLKRVGADPFDIPRHNVTEGRDPDFAAQYDDRAREIGNFVFRRELSQFGYSPLPVLYASAVDRSDPSS